MNSLVSGIRSHRILLCFGLLCTGTVLAQTAEVDELALIYGDKSTVSIATGSQQTLRRAPAVATVITAQDITAMGATTLAQVLETVPGLHVSRLSIGLGTILSFRGNHTLLNSQVLMLVNGVPITEGYAGNRGIPEQVTYTENIARVEVIRGSGSALYGADAFSGVINIITKSASEIKGTELGVRAGNFNTRDAWLLHSMQIGQIEAALYLRSGRTDGQDSMVERDFQTFLDGLFGSHASLAPGRVSAFNSGSDLALDLLAGNWRAHAKYQTRKEGLGLGLADSLDPSSRFKIDKLALDLHYQNSQFAKGWELAALFSYQHNTLEVADSGYFLFPAGAFGGAFPDGMIGAPARKERNTEANLTGLYTAWPQHKIRVGLGAKSQDLYEVTEMKNFTFLKMPDGSHVLSPLPGLVQAQGNPDLVYILPHQRQLWYSFIQDEWALARDLALTAGARYDKYSDFGATTNPRVALVWDAAYNVVLKLIHNRAFRAPSFSEQFIINNPVQIGNPNIKPEKIASNELVISWLASDKLQTNLSFYQHKTKDLIRQVANADPVTGTTAQNTAGQTGKGYELEAAWNPNFDLRLSASLSVQKTTDDVTKLDAGLAPHKRIFLRSDWRFAPSWSLSGSLNHVAERLREPGDLRPALADYNLVDLSLRRERVWSNWDISVSVRNLFNRDAREPSFAPGNVPNDIPLPGRAFWLQLQYRL